MHAQGLEDLTGGIGYKFDLEKREKEWIPPKGSEPDRLWGEMLEKLQTESVGRILLRGEKLLLPTVRSEWEVCRDNCTERWRLH